MTRTDWQVLPSFRYDTLCLLNILTGDPFYVEFNQQAYEHFRPYITADVATALANVKRILKDEGQSIISAQLCLFFSAVGGESLSDMLHVLDDPIAMQIGLQQSPYYEEESWQHFLRSRDDLRTIFRFLETINFADYWQRTILPEVEDKIQGIAAYLSNYDVVSQLEAVIGYTLPSTTITVYVLNYTRPHGIKIIGQRFITAVSWSPQIVLRTAIHEMLHPPYNLNADQPLKDAIEALQKDPFISEKFTTHNTDFGYNSFTGYVEENCVRALDQFVSETFSTARSPQERWREEDGGMHVLAAALYHTLKMQHFTEGFRDFLYNSLQTHLAPGNLKTVYDSFYASQV